MTFPLGKRDALADSIPPPIPKDIFLVEVNGFEPMTFPLGKRDALADSIPPPIPKDIFLVEVNGFEPMTSCVQGRRSPS